MSITPEAETAAVATRITSTLDVLDRAALVTACAGLIGMAVVQGWQVFARYVLNNSPSWTEPLALLCMSTTMMLSAACGVRASRHFGFFILVETSKPKVRAVLLAISSLIAVAIGLMLAVWGAKMVSEAWDYPIAGAPFPQGVAYLPMTLGGLLIAIFAVEKWLSPPAAVRVGE
jgi:TRAP-type C4-dicarboxylate transport system permease small subunit